MYSSARKSMPKIIKTYDLTWDVIKQKRKACLKARPERIEKPRARKRALLREATKRAIRTKWCREQTKKLRLKTETRVGTGYLKPSKKYTKTVYLSSENYTKYVRVSQYTWWDYLKWFIQLCTKDTNSCTSISCISTPMLLYSPSWSPTYSLSHWPVRR